MNWKDENIKVKETYSSGQEKRTSGEFIDEELDRNKNDKK